MQLLNSQVEALFQPGDQTRTISGNQPVVLDDPHKTWLVQSGRVELFTSQWRGGAPVGQRHHVGSLMAGQLIWGLDSLTLGEGTVLLAVGVGQTQLLEMPLARWQSMVDNPLEVGIVAALLDEWLLRLNQALLKDVIAPKASLLVEAAGEQPYRLEAGQDAMLRKEPLWLVIEEGTAFFNGEEELESSVFPLYDNAWLRAAGSDLYFRAYDTRTALQMGLVWPHLAGFYQTFFRCHFTNIGLGNFDEINRLKEKAGHDEWLGQQAIGQLSDLLNLQPAPTPLAGENEGADPLLTACRLVGQSMGLHIGPLPDNKDRRQGPERVREIAYAARFRTRMVLLQGDWWRQDNGPLLAFRAEDGQPIALLPNSPARYEAVCPAEGSRVAVDKTIVGQLSIVAYCFYRPFPERALKAADVVKFGLQGGKKDLGLMTLLGIGGGLLAMLVPVITGVLFDQAIPMGAGGQLFQFFAGLVAAAVAAAAFEIVRSISILRLETRLDLSIQAAVWDRLLSLPLTFFRQYSSGDLAERAMGINSIRQLISGSVVSALLGSLFAVFNLILLFVYDVGLALVATGLTLVTLAVTLGISYRQLHYQRRKMQAEGKLSGLVLQLISGIAKLRVAGSEVRAFALWAKHFAEQKKLGNRAQALNNRLLVFNAAWPILTLVVIFEAIHAFQNKNLTTGSFLAFNAAFSQFLLAMLGLVVAFDAVMQAVTIFERAAPIMETVPEVNTAKVSPGELSGAIEINQVSFRYSPSSPMVLNNVTLKIAPGEFVAIVGPSGSGKSSLLRLLLGFETPESGSIFYDGQDLARLNLQAVRQQIGTVIQNAKLMPGSIYENIVGSAPIGLDQAWEAAELAGLADDIRRMPMTLHTIISEGGGGLSGGQRQRLIIAKAIVNRPRILLFDEATSALDNRTQAIVSRSLENLQATRVVIAHRLSTIINADRIFVMEAGQVVQAGTYDELINQKGPFQELAKRQLA